MRIIPIFVPHEGCPHDCVFCNQRKIASQHSPEPSDAECEIELAIRKTGTGAQLAFYGGSFTAIEQCRQESLLEVGKRYIQRGAIESIRVSTRPDCIDEAVCERLREYGVKTVELGVQSMSDEVLCLSNRGHTSEHARLAVKMLKDFGFEVIVQVMAGLPGDSEEISLYTAKETAKLRPDGTRIYPVVVIRDTALFDMWEAGVYVPLTPQQGAFRASLMLEEYIKHDIPVIRIGLNPTEDLSGGGAVAGAYHPALGEIARGYIYRRLAERLLDTVQKGETAEMYVNPSFVSCMTGIKRENVLFLEEKYSIRLKIKPSAELDAYEAGIKNTKSGSGMIVSKIDRYSGV
ncbi:MAG: radical SAM protein [Clostridiales bacterium]|jgi:histone acetyltransferase (RNA polymerase elongator complex component)|nr:radical SAM protein [Clostridiales bacterium]